MLAATALVLVQVEEYPECEKQKAKARHIAQECNDCEDKPHRRSP